MDMLELYRNQTFDLSVFGIERGDSRSDYFCTPKGAVILGWTGVDGIHYCTIRTLGEMIFAVEPMGDAGRHAFPVAESFDDFLRLLMACGHEAYLEQAHAWSREKYDDFARNNPPTEAAGEQSAYLQNEYGLQPMEDPYEYLKTIYDRFDFSRVPYKKDYYEYVPREEMPQPKEWKVYFSLHDRKGGERAGEELPLNAVFSWAGYDWMVPSAYVCAKGLVLDVFAEADSDKVYEFLFKQMYAENEPTAEQQQQCQNENPLALDYRARAAVNGKLLEESQGHGNGWVQGYEPYCSESMKEILTHYGLGLDRCWIWKRVSFPWATKTKPRVKSLALHLEQHPMAMVGEHFTVTEAGQQLRFTHPFTHTQHTLTVTEYGQDRLNVHTCISDGYEHPTYCTKLAYTVMPELSNREFSVSDTRPSDAPKKTSVPAREYDFVSTTAIMIIGGADGPTAVILGVPRQEPSLHAACSALTFAPQTKVEWKMIFRVKTVEDVSVCLK